MSPIGYAMWYADDGTTVLVQYNELTKSARSRRVQFCTDNFTENEVKNLLLPMVSKQFGSCSVRKRKEGIFRIEIDSNLNYDSQKFLQTIHEYFYNNFPSLIYKMDLGYRNEALERRTYVSEAYHKLYLKISAHNLFKDRLIDRK